MSSSSSLLSASINQLIEVLTPLSSLHHWPVELLTIVATYARQQYIVLYGHMKTNMIWCTPLAYTSDTDVIAAGSTSKFALTATAGDADSLWLTINGHGSSNGNGNKTQKANDPYAFDFAPFLAAHKDPFSFGSSSSPSSSFFTDEDASSSNTCGNGDSKQTVITTIAPTEAVPLLSSRFNGDIALTPSSLRAMTCGIVYNNELCFGIYVPASYILSSCGSSYD
jgi:hypothetical protein